MKKRFIIKMLWFLLVIPLMWAGGQKEAVPEEKVTLVHIHWTQPPYDEILMNSAKSFMAENPNVEVKALTFAAEDFVTKIRTTISSGGQLDTFALSSMDTAWFMANDLVADIIPSAFGKNTVQEVVDMWEPNSFKGSGCSWEGKDLGIPHQLSGYVAWINTAHMKEAGLNPKSDIPNNWEDFVSVCKKMTKDEGGVRVRNGFAINVKAAAFPFLILHTLMGQKGMDWSTEKGLLESLDKKEALEAFTTFTNFATKDNIFDPGLFANEREGFGNGLCSTFLTGGSWYWGVLDNYEVPREDVTPMQYPRFKGGKDVGGVVYGYSVFVSKSSENKEWSWKWLDYFESEPKDYIVHGKTQPRKNLDPELLKKYIEQYDVFQAERRAGAAILSSTKMVEIQDAVGESVSKVIFQGMTNKEALNKLRENIKKILE